MPKQDGPFKLQHFNVVTVPKKVRDKLELHKGDLVIWVIDDEGRCILKKVKMTVEVEG